MKKLLCILLIIINFSNLLFAEVYWLKNFTSNDNLSKNNIENIEAILSTDIVFQDDLIINGYDTKMNVGNSRYSFEELIYMLKNIDYNLINIVDFNTILINIKVNDYTQKKYLICNIINGYDAVVFSMNLPLKFSKKLSLYNDLDGLIRGVDIENIVEYPKRKAKYITFSNVANPISDMQYIRDILKSRGFQSLSNTDSINDLNELFINYKTNETICISFDQDSRTGLIYQKKK